MGKVLRVRGVELTSMHWLVTELAELCRETTLSAHCYAVYHLLHDPSETEIVLKTSGREIESYILVWRGSRLSITDVYEIHVWSLDEEVLNEVSISPNTRADVQLYGDPLTDVHLVIERLRKLGFKRFATEKFHDMICTPKSFRPSPLERIAIRLSSRYASLYRDLELERGVEISLEEAKEVLETYTHYGVIINNTLASVAARYLTLPWIHVVGGVYTRKGFRGRGYAKAVVSALTREALTSGAIAGLHVEVGNESAIRVYEGLGYRILRTRTWIFAYP